MTTLSAPPGLDELADAIAAQRALSMATAGLVLRSAAIRFDVGRADLRRPVKWPDPAAKAKAATIYLLVTDAGYSVAAAGALVGVARKTAGLLRDRMADLRDDHPEMESWFADLGEAIRGRGLVMATGEAA